MHINISDTSNYAHDLFNVFALHSHQEENVQTFDFYQT